MRPSLIALTLLAGLAAGCDVTRTQAKDDTGAADLPSLKRASAALEELIRREKAHVDQYNVQLRDLEREEERLYNAVQDGEATIAQLEGDLDFTELDLEDVEAALAEVEQALSESQQRLDATRAELAATETELSSLRAAAERDERLLIRERERADAIAGELAAVRAQAEAATRMRSAVTAHGMGVGGWRDGGAIAVGPLIWGVLMGIPPGWIPESDRTPTAPPGDEAGDGSDGWSDAGVADGAGSDG